VIYTVSQKSEPPKHYAITAANYVDLNKI